MRISVTLGRAIHHLLKSLLLLLTTLSASHAAAQLPDTILFGVAYYDEYTPVDRIDEDARLMKAANITVVRIAESTWGTLEREPGVNKSPYLRIELNCLASAMYPAASSSNCSLGESQSWKRMAALGPPGWATHLPHARAWSTRGTDALSFLGVQHDGLEQRWGIWGFRR